MSEETNVQEMQPAKKCNYEFILVAVIVSLVLSIVSIGASIYTIASGHMPSAGSKGGKVVISKQYDKGQSLEKALATKKPMIVFFYTDWCGFCQRFIPTFAKVTKDKEIKKNFAVAYVNCEDQNNRKHMEEYGVEGFPTVFVVDEKNNRTHLDNNTFFNDDSVDVVKANALKAIGK